MISVRPLLILTACLPLVRVRRGPVQPDRQRVLGPGMPSAGPAPRLPGRGSRIQAADQNTRQYWRPPAGTAISATSELSYPDAGRCGLLDALHGRSDPGVLPANFSSPALDRRRSVDEPRTPRNVDLGRRRRVSSPSARAAPASAPGVRRGPRDRRRCGCCNSLAYRAVRSMQGVSSGLETPSVTIQGMISN